MIWRRRSFVAAALAGLAAAVLGLAAAPSRAGTAGRVEVPISQLKLSDGTVRYSVPVKVGRSGPIQAMLDTGSFGLRVMSSALAPGDYEDTGQERHYGFGSGVVLNGNLVKAVVEIGDATTGSPVVLQLVNSVSCRAERPVCPASKMSQEDYRIGGDGLPREGFRAILGLSMRAPRMRPAALNPLADVGDQAWIVVLPLPGESAPGKLIINPTPQDRAGFQSMPVTRKTGPDDQVRLIDGQLPVCLDGTGPNLGSCPLVKLDSGDSDGVRPYFSFAVLYDQKEGVIGVKPRPDAH